MVVEGILNIVFGVLRGLLSLLPDIHWNCDEGLMGTFADLISVVLYIFPSGVVADILLMVIAFNVFKIVVAIIRTIWNLIPLV